MNPLHIGDLTLNLPIIQGGMGVGVSLSGLAAAVANEGGAGIISAVGIGMTEPGFRKNFRESNKIAIRKEIRKARLLTDGVIGINIMLAISDFDDLLDIALQEQVDMVIVGAGLFLKKPENYDSKNTKLIPKVSSSRAARIIFRHWSERYAQIPDAVVVEGPLCGGHVGFREHELKQSDKMLPVLLQETIKEMIPFEQKYGRKIPVIAGGGIYDGKDMYEIMKLGASAVKIGTRFVTTVECDAAEEFKQNYIDAGPEDITIIHSPVGLPGRVISNDFVKEIQAGMQKPVNCPWKCLKTCDYNKVQFCIAEALFNAAKGEFEHGFSFAGSNAWKAEKITTVREAIEQIKAEYLHQEMEAVERLGSKIEEQTI